MRGSILVCSILIASLASVLPQGTPKANVGSDKISAKPAEQAAAAPADGGDVIIRAMKEELARSRELAISSLDVPYFIEYEMDEATQFSVSASLGGILQSSQNRFRIPRARVRVGDYKFDNTNYVFADLFGGTRYASERFPLDDNLRALRFEWWLATDRAYKGAVEAIARKRAALKNITQADEVPDFWKATPVTKVMPVSKFSVDTARWTNRVREWSNLFVKYPEVLSSSVSFDASQSIHYIHNTEGTTLRVPETLHYVTLRAAAQAPDGMSVRDYTMLAARASSDLPPEAEQSKAITALAENVKSLAAAPLAESYSGPVLFEGVAASQVLADVFGAQLSVPRRPVSDSSRNLPFQPSELEGRIGSRVLPEDFDLVDDPSLTNWKGRPLLGSYAVDEEGVVPKPLNVVEKGKLQHMLLTRQPVRGFEGSNGRARVPGPYGARAATFSNLILKTSAPTKDTDLKKKLLDIIGKRNKPYGMIVRKLDFPSTASMEEFRQMAASSGGGRPASAPILVYRVYPDGREELVRGLRFRGLNVRSFRDILAAGSESHVFHLLNNLAPMSLVGAGSYVAPQSVIAPSLIFEDVELDRPQENMPKVPVVPPPALVSSR